MRSILLLDSCVLKSCGVFVVFTFIVSQQNSLRLSDMCISFLIKHQVGYETCVVYIFACHRYKQSMPNLTYKCQNQATGNDISIGENLIEHFTIFYYERVEFDTSQ